MKLAISFTQHPASVGESYLEHLIAAGTFGLRMVFGGLACVIHALLPFLFITTASDCVVSLHRQMTRRRVTAEHPLISAHSEPR